MIPRWYVVRSEARAEYLAAKELMADGLEVFFPRIKTRYPRIGHLDTPLFPGYLFIRCNPEVEGWPLLQPRHRISRWLGFGGVVSSVPDEVITEVVQRVEGINCGQGLWRKYRPGEKVQIVSNGIESLAEVLEEAKSPQAQATVLFEFMGRLVQAKVPWEDIRPFEEQHQVLHLRPRRTRGKGRWVRGFEPDGAPKASPATLHP